MRVLLLHCEHFEYSTREPAVANPESLSPEDRQASFEKVLVAFCTVEKEDETNPEDVAGRATSEIAQTAQSLSEKRILVYPYAHLSNSLANPLTAIAILERLTTSLKSMGFETHRSPFGYYKSFSLRCLGHPLSELSRTIRPQEKRIEPVAVKPEYMILDLDGRLCTPDEYYFKAGDDDFKILVDREVFKKSPPGGEPRFLGYCRKFGIEWETFSDLGHMRYGPEAVTIFDLISDYSWNVANSIGIPVFQIKGTNMFDLSIPAVKEHADLFGSRLYRIDTDDKSLVMRYAACHQQFAAVSSWPLSYRDLPFGTFEVADAYRLEQSGELLLAFRLRKLHMPDCHIYCKNLDEAKAIALQLHRLIYDEIRRIGANYVALYNVTRRFTEENMDYLMELVRAGGKPALLNYVPEGIYYWVVNVEYNIIDELERAREIATFQIDVGNARRFGISFANEHGTKEFPLIIHTAVIGTVERYLFTILDQCAKAEAAGRKPSLPLWLSPIQVRFIPVRDEFVELTKPMAENLAEYQIRADIDDRGETVERRVRDAELNWIPFIAVVGRKEAESNKLTVRRRSDGNQYQTSLSDLRAEILDLTRGFPKVELKMPVLVSRRPVYKQPS